MLKGFKEFVMRGNLVELAVAFIMATAFAAVVTTFTTVILSLATAAFGGEEPNFDELTPGGIPVGPFLTAVTAFLMLAAVLYFFVVTPYNRLQERRAKGEEPSPPSQELALLTEIRDLLREQAGRGTSHAEGGPGSSPGNSTGNSTGNSPGSSTTG